MKRILVHKATGIPVAVGDVVTTFRGESATVEGWDEPRTPESTGRVTIRIGKAEPFPYYPSVIDAEWREYTGLMAIHKGLTREEALAEFRLLIGHYGIQWRADVPSHAWDRLAKVNEILTEADRRAALGL